MNPQISSKSAFIRSCSQRMSLLVRLTLTALVILTTVGSTAVAQSDRQELKVVDHIWGFDGRVQPGQFNPLSILLDNQTNDPIEATASLQRIQGMLNYSGGQYQQNIFIAPTKRLWIQFYPYVSNSYTIEWELTVNDGDKFKNVKLEEFTQPRPAIKLDSDQEIQLPQVIILDKSDAMMALPTTVKHLPENIFPPYASATVGLHSVFLDHNPDWELPRQQAFMSWLKMGGRLHLLKDRRDEFPKLSGALADLNQPLSEFNIESGKVTRHSIQREDVTEDLVRRISRTSVLRDELTDADQIRKVNTPGMYIETEPSSIDDSMFREMRELTFPEHNWFLIFTLALAYIGLLFPGCYVLSKKKQYHFLSTYGAIAGLSIVFSVLFLMIGRRGYGESTNIQTMAIARAEDATHWSVFQWNTFFVTAGDNYQAGSDGQQSVFSTANTMDRENVTMTSGSNGRIRMRIPPYSSQTFVSRRHVTASNWNLKLLAHSLDPTGLVSLSIQTGDDFPALTTNEYMALAGSQIYTLRFDSGTKRLELIGTAKSLSQYCQPNMDAMYQNPWNMGYSQPDDVRSEKQRFMEDSLTTLVSRSLLDDLTNRPHDFQLPADRIRLFVYTDIPEEFRMPVSEDVQETGRILFVKDLPLQDSTQTPN